jgi:hypothetical protein
LIYVKLLGASGLTPPLLHRTKAPWFDVESSTRFGQLFCA